jgi:hypothetical protein
MVAAVEGVEGETVVGGEVDVFDDVDFSVVGPDGALGPEGGPERALRGGFELLVSSARIKAHTPKGICTASNMTRSPMYTV